MTSKVELSNLADELGTVRATMATLKTRETKIRNIMIAAGGSAYEGKTYRATVVEAVRTLIDWKKVAAKLNPSRQLVTSYTTKKDVTSIRMSTPQGAS